MSLLVEGLFEDIPTLEESSLLTALPLIACVKLINASLVSCVDMAQLCFSTNTGYAHKVFQALPVNPGFLGNAKTLASGKTKWRQIVDDPERCRFYDTKDKDLSSHPAPSCRRVENVRGTMVTSRLANCNLETRSLADL